MIKYWYVVQKEQEYWIGCAYGKAEAAEGEILGIMNQYCVEKGYRLALLAVVSTFPRMVNQVYPVTVTEESTMCLDNLLSCIFNDQ